MCNPSGPNSSARGFPPASSIASKTSTYTTFGSCSANARIFAFACAHGRHHSLARETWLYRNEDDRNLWQDPANRPNEVFEVFEDLVRRASVRYVVVARVKDDLPRRVGNDDASGKVCGISDFRSAKASVEDRRRRKVVGEARPKPYGGASDEQNRPGLRWILAIALLEGQDLRFPFGVRPRVLGIDAERERQNQRNGGDDAIHHFASIFS